MPPQSVSKIFDPRHTQASRSTSLPSHPGQPLHESNGLQNVAAMTQNTGPAAGGVGIWSPIRCSKRQIQSAAARSLSECECRSWLLPLPTRLSSAPMRITVSVRIYAARASGSERTMGSLALPAGTFRVRPIITAQFTRAQRIGGPRRLLRERW